MTATDRYRFFVGDYPRTRMPLRYRAQYSDRVSVYRGGGFIRSWHVTAGGASLGIYSTHAAAITYAQTISHDRAVRAIVDGAA